MAYTFLEVTNLVLREVNEVPLTEQLFLNARGLQKFAREAVNRSFFDISNASTEWPWLQDQVFNTANTEIRRLVAGQAWYDTKDILTETKQEADWDTFLLTDKDLLSTDPDVIASTPELVCKLPYVTYEEWTRRYREQDFAKTNAGVPQRIVRHPSGKFGVSPVPDQDYWVEFNVSNAATRFTDPIEEIPFPEEFVNVLVARCAYYVWKFRENHEQAQFSLMEYKEALKDMKRVFLSNKEDVMKAV